MSLAEQRGFDSPDETRTFPFGKLDLLKIGGAEIGRSEPNPQAAVVITLQHYEQRYVPRHSHIHNTRLSAWIGRSVFVSQATKKRYHES